MSELGLLIHCEPAADGSTEIGVVGPLTHATAPALRDTLRRAINAEPTRLAPQIRLDLRCCTDIDTDGLLALSVAQHAARVHGGHLHLEHVPPLLDRQIRQHHFDCLLHDPNTQTPDPSHAPSM